MLRLCTDCIYRKLRPTERLVSAGSGASPAQTGAAGEELRIEQRERQLEQQRLQDNEIFDYEPKYLEWCDKYTPKEELLQAILGEIQCGNTTYEEVRSLTRDYCKMSFVVDPAKGVLRPHYAICARVNRNADCPAFERK